MKKKVRLLQPLVSDVISASNHVFIFSCNLIPETGCPSPSEVSCTEGDLCSKHKQCGEDHICCPNKCYRRRCVPGTATSAELAEESDEESEEDRKEEAAPQKTTPSDVRQGN